MGEDQRPAGDQEAEDALRLPSLRRRKPPKPPKTPKPSKPLKPAQAPKPPKAERPPRRARVPRRPAGSPLLPPRVATALTGALVGASGAGLTYAGMRGCELVRGTSSCGGPGLFVLVAICAVMVLLGALLLRLLRVPEPGSTSFLGVGVVVVLVMVALLDVVFSGWMFLVVPALGAAAYPLAHWVTTRFDDEG